MASARDELASLKLRVAKKQGDARITIIDHTANEHYTLTVAEGVKFLANLVEKGSGERPVHIVDHAEEKRRKLTNPRKSTKKILNCRTPEQWTEWNAAEERFFDIAVDPHLALDLMIRALKAPDEATLRAWLAEGHQQEGDRPAGPPKSELPDIPSWLK